MGRDWIKKSKEAEMAPVVDVNDVNHISAHTTIKGDISSENDIRIDGRVDGTIYSGGKIVVGDKSVIVGRILCSDLDFAGKMEGDVYVKNTMHLRSTGSIKGSLSTGKFESEMDAVINGAVNMIQEEDFDRFVENLVTCELPSPAPTTSEY